MASAFRLMSHPALFSFLTIATRPVAVGVLMGIAWLLTGLTLLLRDDSLYTGFSFAIPLAVIATCVSILAGRFNAEQDSRNKSPRSMVPTIGVVLLVLQVVLFAVALQKSSAMGRGKIAEQNLRAAWDGMMGYQAAHQRPVPDMKALAASGRVSPQKLISPADPNQGENGAATRTSFDYLLPRVDIAGDPAIILLYEREPWFPTAVSILPPPRGRHVLFFDGTVRLLEEAEFTRAKDTDQHKRKELGWDAPPRRP